LRHADPECTQWHAFYHPGIINIRNENGKMTLARLIPAWTAMPAHFTPRPTFAPDHQQRNFSAQIASIHNLTFYCWLVGQARLKIEEVYLMNGRVKMVKIVSQRL